MRTQKLIAKKAAQDWLMCAMRIAISRFPDTDASQEQQRLTIEQYRRIEKLFGYEPGFWPLNRLWPLDGKNN